MNSKGGKMKTGFASTGILVTALHSMCSAPPQHILLAIVPLINSNQFSEMA